MVSGGARAVCVGVVGCGSGMIKPQEGTLRAFACGLFVVTVARACGAVPALPEWPGFCLRPGAFGGLRCGCRRALGITGWCGFGYTPVPGPARGLAVWTMTSTWVASGPRLRSMAARLSWAMQAELRYRS